MKAFNNRSGLFEKYGEMPLTLCAFTDCMGCEAVEEAESLHFVERLNQLKKIGVEKIHLGICTGDKYCKNSEEIFNIAKANGFEVELGTHL